LKKQIEEDKEKVEKLSINMRSLELYNNEKKREEYV